MSSRVTRSRSRANTPLSSNDTSTTKTAKQSTTSRASNQAEPPSSHFQIPSVLFKDESRNIQKLPQDLKRKDTKLTNSDHTLLRLKQQKLRALNLPTTYATQERYGNRSSTSRKRLQQQLQVLDQALVGDAVAATLIFASDSAGTAVFIHEAGVILTCAHCIAESCAELDSSVVKGVKVFWLLTAAGDAVSTRCVAWDEKRDLALLRVIAAQPAKSGDGTKQVFSSIVVASTSPLTPSPVLCIGHPGSEDLESDEPALTDYPVLAISEGQFLGYAADQDVQDNHEIGALMHDAWTYWGHSGAPIVGVGALIGLHSSWDDETGIRRGVGGEAIRTFLNNIAIRAPEHGFWLL